MGSRGKAAECCWLQSKVENCVDKHKGADLYSVPGEEGQNAAFPEHFPLKVT